MLKHLVPVLRLAVFGVAFLVAGMWLNGRGQVAGRGAESPEAVQPVAYAVPKAIENGSMMAGDATVAGEAHNYQIQAYYGTMIDRCYQSGVVRDAARKAGDAAALAKWTATHHSDCQTAKVPE